MTTSPAGWRHFPFPIRKQPLLPVSLLMKYFIGSPLQNNCQGKQFKSEVVASMCKLLGISKTRTTPYHPQFDGLIERFNQALLSMLRIAASENPFEWEDHLRPLCMAYNSSVHPTTGYTPFYFMFGRNTRIPIDLMYGSCPTEVNQPSNANEFVAKLQDRLQKAYTCVQDTMGHQLDRQKELYDE